MQMLFQNRLLTIGNSNLVSLENKIIVPASKSCNSFKIHIHKHLDSHTSASHQRDMNMTVCKKLLPRVKVNVRL